MSQRAPREGPHRRLFIALRPPAEVADALRERCTAAMPQERHSCLPAERLHLTLHFLGAVHVDRLASLQAGVCGPFPAFELALSVLEHWPRGLFVIRPLAAPAGLIQLHAGLGHRLRSLALKTDSRPFQPHLTLGRYRAGRGAAPPRARQHPQKAPTTEPSRPITWEVRDYVLCESVPGPPPRYLTLQTCAGLAPAPSQR